MKETRAFYSRNCHIALFNERDPNPPFLTEPISSNPSTDERLSTHPLNNPSFIIPAPMLRSLHLPPNYEPFLLLPLPTHALKNASLIYPPSHPPNSIPLSQVIRAYQPTRDPIYPPLIRQITHISHIHQPIVHSGSYHQVAPSLIRAARYTQPPSPIYPSDPYSSTHPPSIF